MHRSYGILIGTGRRKYIVPKQDIRKTERCPEPIFRVTFYKILCIKLPVGLVRIIYPVRERGGPNERPVVLFYKKEVHKN